MKRDFHRHKHSARRQMGRNIPLGRCNTFNGDFQRKLVPYAAADDILSILDSLTYWEIRQIVVEHSVKRTLGEHGLYPRSAIILFGDDHTAQKEVASWFAKELHYETVYINCESIHELSAEDVESIFATASELAEKRRCVVFVDELDAICDSPVQGYILNSLCGLAKIGIVIASVKKLSWLDTKTRESFNIELPVNRPNKSQLLYWLSQFYNRVHSYGIEFSPVYVADSLREILPELSFHQLKEFANSILRDHIICKKFSSLSHPVSSELDFLRELEKHKKTNESL